MRATIDENGRLMVEPESALEAFALRKWMESARADESGVALPVGLLSTKTFIVSGAWPSQTLIDKLECDQVVNNYAAMCGVNKKLIV